MKKLFTCFVILSLLTSLKSQVTSPTFNPVAAEKLQNALDSIIELYEWRGASCAMIVPGQGTWIGTSGVSHEITPVTPDMKFNIASNTKLFTAVCIMKLQELGLLDLNDPIGDYLPDYANVNPTATIRQLLQHTSGIFDVLNDGPGFVNAIFTDVTVSWEPEEQLEYVGLPHFEPGNGYRYSNTNTLLAGLIIESVTGEDYLNSLHEFILDPLDMDSTFMAYWEPPVYPVSHIYLDTEDQGEDPLGYYSFGWSYGGLFSTAREMAQWYKALFNYEIISESSLNQVIDVNSFSTWGLGIFRVFYPYSNSDMNKHKGYSHGGDLFNYHSQVYYDVDTKSTMCVLTNDAAAVGAYDIFIRAFADILHSDISKVANDAGIKTITIPANNICQSESAPEVTIYNYGADNLTAVEIHYGFEGGIDNVYAWEGNIPFSEEESMILPVISETDGNKSFYAYTTTPNSYVDSVAFNDAYQRRINISTGTSIAAPFFEDFETGEEVFDRWINNSNKIQNFTWVVQDFSEYSGNMCLAKNNYVDAIIGSIDEIESPVIDISALSNPALSFQYAYAQYPGYSDRLQIYVSADCGATFNEIFNEVSAGLATSPATYNLFFADTSDFEYYSIDLNDYAGGDIIIKFRITNGFSNSLFIDDIKVDGQPVGIENLAINNSIDIYPNPFTSSALVQFDKSISNSTCIIYDLLGNKLNEIKNIDGDVFTLQRNNLPAGNYVFSIFEEGELKGTGKFIVQ